jgi:hypothetical protein
MILSQIKMVTNNRSIHLNFFVDETIQSRGKESISSEIDESWLNNQPSKPASYLILLPSSGNCLKKFNS